MSNIVAQYVPRAMPKDYVTTEKHYTIKTNKDGTKSLECEEVESKGGILFEFPRGHSIRLTSEDQIKQFNLSKDPKLVDLSTGEEVDANGVPLSLKSLVDRHVESRGDFGDASTDDE